MTSRFVVLATIILTLPVLIFWIWLLTPITRIKMLCPATCTCDALGKSIDCSSLSLSNIPDIHLKDVRTLHLGDNNLTCLRKDRFLHMGLTQLEALTLHNSEIVTVEPGAFSGLTKLETLFLGYNTIREIKSRTFGNMSELYTLYLDNNKIETLESDSFSGLLKLDTLWLHNNKIRYLSADVFSSLPSLETLNLGKNQCLKIPNDTPFIKSPSLKKLSMHDCNISSLSVETFANVTALKELDLDSNGLKNFDVNTIKILSHLSTLHLEGNPLECDSQFQEVLLWGQCHNINILTECIKPKYDQFPCYGDYSNASYKYYDSDTDTDIDLDTLTRYTPYLPYKYGSFLFQLHIFLQQYVPVTVFVAVFTLGAAGNVALLLIIICNREMRTVPNMYIFNLVLSDLISLTVNMPVLLLHLTSSWWYYDRDLCLILEFFVRLSVGLSAYFLAVLSIKRYYVTVNPLQYRVSSQGTWRVAVATVCGVWILAAAFAIPSVFSVHTDIYCSLYDNYTYYKRVVLFELLVSCILPLFAIVFSYVMTARLIMKSALPISDGVQHPQANARKNTANIVLGLSTVFVISYMPYHIIWAYQFYSNNDTEQALSVTRSVSTCLLVFNSCFNPVALCCTSSAFRRHFKRCLMCYCKRTNCEVQTRKQLI